VANRCFRGGSSEHSQLRSGIAAGSPGEAR
jgi:hypothetical protein